MDPLEFVDMKPYPDRVRDSQDKTGMNDAIRTGTGACGLCVRARVCVGVAARGALCVLSARVA
jgi:acetyl-CoA carboxylase beta subunit